VLPERLVEDTVPTHPRRGARGRGAPLCWRFERSHRHFALRRQLCAITPALEWLATRPM